MHWFIGDERFVPAGDPLNNMRMARNAASSTAYALEANIHPIATNRLSMNPDKSAEHFTNAS